MTPPVSVIVVSRHRTVDLLRCIEALRQQDHPRMELIVVTDPVAAAAVRALALPIRLVEFDKANISAARNVGLSQAAGGVVAFIDDDAVAEPTWARRMTEPFSCSEVVQACGFVRGRNGISYQWRAMEVDATARDHPLEVPDETSLHRGSAARSVKTQGTNCAFRRDGLLGIGGFDPALRFYLDEADVNLRLVASGGLTAVVPGGQVHHRFAASARRRGDRTPLTLHEIGASTAVFLRRHAPDQATDALAALRDAQRIRLLRMVVSGGIEPRDVARLTRTLDAGIAEGLQRPIVLPPPMRASAAAFQPLSDGGARGGIILSGWSSRRRRVTRAACTARGAGNIVTVLLLSPGMRRHRMRFGEDGIWWQTGGIFGASERSDPVFVPWRWKTRIARETARLSTVRPITGLV